MLDAPFWQDTGVYWTDRPAWLSDEDASPDASSLGLVALDVTIRTDALIAVNPVTAGFVAQTPDVAVLTVVAVDVLPMTTFTKDFAQAIESTVVADVVGVSVTQGEASSGYIVGQDVDFVPVNIVPRDPYIFTQVTLTPGVIPLSMSPVDDHLYGVLQVIQADALPLAVTGEFYYFEITSSLAIDFLSSTMEVNPFTLVSDSLIEADALGMTTATYDAPPLSNCLVDADSLTLGLAAVDTDSQWDSIFEAPELALSVTFVSPTQRTSFVFDQDEVLLLAAALQDYEAVVDVSAAPSLLTMTLADVLDFDVIASSNVEADLLEIATGTQPIDTERSESFTQDEALPMATALFGTTYVGRMAFEGAVLSTPVTTALVISTPVNLVQDFEGIQ